MYINLWSLKCSTCVDFLTIVVIVASTDLLPLATSKEFQISPKGVGRAQRLPGNIVAELTPEPPLQPEHVGILNSI